MKEALHSKDEGQNPHQRVKGTVYVARLRVGGGGGRELGKTK